MRTKWPPFAFPPSCACVRYSECVCVHLACCVFWFPLLISFPFYFIIPTLAAFVFPHSFGFFPANFIEPYPRMQWTMRTIASIGLKGHIGIGMNNAGEG